MENWKSGYYGDSIYKEITEKAELTSEEKLKIHITYKIAIKNQSTEQAKITEIVDYFDKKYTYIDSYIGNKKGEKIGNVDSSNISIYGTQSQYTSSLYNTIFLKPDEKTLSENEELYIYVRFQLQENTNDAEVILKEQLMNGNTVNTMNLAEINGYKTNEGLIDIDSIPGNANTSKIEKLLQGDKSETVKNIYEDDISLSPQIKYNLTTNSTSNKIEGSRTIEGIAFEDSTGKDEKVYTKSLREGDGKLQEEETKIAGVIVQLVEIKNGQNIIRAQTRTDNGGWYGFIGYLPGEYKIRYIYGYDDKTAMTNNPPKGVEAGLNKKSYNGHDYQSTKYNEKADKYWYIINNEISDAKDNETRKQKVIDYSKTILNHKAEVLDSYKTPTPSHIDQEKTRELANELEQNTYRYADTENMDIEIEYAIIQTEGNEIKQYKIKGIDFGIVERPKTKLELDQDIKSIKITLADGTEYINTEKSLEHIQWLKDEATDKNEKINITMDEEIMNGSTIEIVYDITLKNKSELDTKKIKANTIVNYVSNNLNYNEQDNLTEDGKPLWEIVKIEDVQSEEKDSLINKEIDLTTQSVILKASNNNPLITKELYPEEGKDEVISTLKLRKIITPDNSLNNLVYTNMTEIVEIENELGRKNPNAIPGNQALNEQPKEHDTSGASQNTTFDKIGQPDSDNPPDGTVIILPPTGSRYVYYILGITSSIILAIGIILIKKKVIDKK